MTDSTKAKYTLHVRCVERDDKNVIVAVGGLLSETGDKLGGQGGGGKSTRFEAVRLIGLISRRPPLVDAYTTGPEFADIHPVTEHHLRTDHDEVESNNLGKLPACPKGVENHPRLKGE